MCVSAVSGVAEWWVDIEMHHILSSVKDEFSVLTKDD